MIPKRFEFLLFGFVLSGLMSLLVAGISTLRTTGPVPTFAGQWLGTWLAAWPAAPSSAQPGRPLARRFVRRLLRDDDPATPS